MVGNMECFKHGRNDAAAKFKTAKRFLRTPRRMSSAWDHKVEYITRWNKIIFTTVAVFLGKFYVIRIKIFFPVMLNKFNIKLIGYMRGFRKLRCNFF